MDQRQSENQQQRRNIKKLLLILNSFLLIAGGCGGPLITRLYFVQGGKRLWLSSFLESCGFPIILIPLLISYIYRRHRTATSELIFFMKPRLFLASAVIGIITGFDNFLYAYGFARLPVSTSALISASQLIFTAVFALLLVKQKFTPYSVNAIVLLTVGGAVLALHSSGDRPAGESNTDYAMGFLMTVGAAVVYGFIMPLVELTYRKARQQITYTLVLEMQLIISLFATLVATIGMVINHDFKVISMEAEAFGLGSITYYVILVSSAVIWQCFFLGVIGVIFSSSSLFGGIAIAVLLPVTEILAIFTFKEKFQPEKAISLILNLWGFVSYFYGEFKHDRDLQTNNFDF